MASDIPVYKVPSVDPREATALHWNNVSALAEVVQAIAFESYPDPASEVHEAVRQRRMDVAEAMRLLAHRCIMLFVAPPQAPAPRGRAKGKLEIEAERATLRDAVAAASGGVDAHITDLPMPQAEDLRHRALDLAASAMMFHLGLVHDSKLEKHMTRVTTAYLSAPDGIPPWQTALQSQFALASLWMRDRRKLTAKDIAISICARVAAVPGAPSEFAAPTADQIDALATVIKGHLRPGTKAFRIPEVNKHAGGSAAGRTLSSWQMALEFAEVLLDKAMPRAFDARRPPRPRKKN